MSDYDFLDDPYSNLPDYPIFEDDGQIRYPAAILPKLAERMVEVGLPDFLDEDEALREIDLFPHPPQKISEADKENEPPSRIDELIKRIKANLDTDAEDDNYEENENVTVPPFNYDSAGSSPLPVDAEPDDSPQFCQCPKKKCVEKTSRPPVIQRSYQRSPPAPRIVRRTSSMDLLQRMGVIGTPSQPFERPRQPMISRSRSIEAAPAQAMRRNSGSGAILKERRTKRRSQQTNVRRQVTLQPVIKRHGLVFVHKSQVNSR